MWLLPLLIAAASSMSQPKRVSEKPTEIVQHGELSQHDSEITILINSTFEIIEGLESNLTDIDSSTETIEEELVTPSPHTLRFQKMRPASRHGSSSNCKAMTSKEKYSMLEEMGSRNQLLMADTSEEASRGFAQSYPQDSANNDATIDVLSVKAGYQNVDSSPCDEKCTLIKRTLDEATAQQKYRAVMSAVWSDAGQPEVDEGIFSAGCYLENFVPIGNCTELGAEASWEYEHLCSECRGVYVMSQNCFPKFLNAVQCNNQELGCIFNSFSNKAHGVCQMQTLILNVLRNKGTAACENWIVEQIQLPVACQCMLSKSSWLRSAPPKEL